MKEFSKTFNDEIKKLNLTKNGDIQIFDYGITIKDLLYSKNYKKAVKRLKYLWNEKKNNAHVYISLQKFIYSIWIYMLLWHMKS